MTHARPSSSKVSTYSPRVHPPSSPDTPASAPAPPSACAAQRQSPSADTLHSAHTTTRSKDDCETAGSSPAHSPYTYRSHQDQAHQKDSAERIHPTPAIHTCRTAHKNPRLCFALPSSESY